MFKQVTISPNLQAKKRFLPIIEHATQVLEEMVKSAPIVEVEWDLAKDQLNSDVVELSLKDWAGEVRGVYQPDELASADDMYRPFLQLYGDLVQNRSHKQLEKLLVPAEVGEPA